MGLWKKISPRRSQVRRNISADRFSQISRFANTDVLVSILIWLLFVVLCTLVLSLPKPNSLVLMPTGVIVVLVSLAGFLYIHQYQKRIRRNHARALVLVSLFVLMLAATRLGVLSTEHTFLATGTAITTAIILTIAYDQRFALGMSTFYCLLASLAVGAMPSDEPQLTNINLFLTMSAGAVTCCFCLKEIRTRIKLLQVSMLATVVVFTMAGSLDSLAQKSYQSQQILRDAALHAGITLVVGVLIQGLLPLIERIFRIATSMTLLDYSDANQRLLKRLHMEAPGTFSHSLLIGSIAEAAAGAIGRNGLLCRVGAYYHDIGKINKAGYFVENELGSASRHEKLSPTMSHLIIVGHVKDGIEMAKEYGLPSVLRQFIEAHHGTTLIEPFYNEAKKLKARGSKGKAAELPSESEFRYPGPKPRTKEAAIVMLADTVEGAVRSLSEVTPTKIEAVVHNMAMKRLQDGQFDECDLSLRELSQIEASISKTLAAHYHGRIAYPQPPDMPATKPSRAKQPAHESD
ncbi:MAG TPA: HDIG domain-containing protein [Sedimentisphaerales bacterium]|jgi:putative nucleotidyltransferase with HDIG domain|nr:HDIG domain-containing protein [Sedimentisphaerales bacterium]